MPVLVAGLSAQQPVRSAASPTAIESGKKLFVQRCSVCHLPPLGPGQPQSIARSLTGLIKSTETEASARQIILRGLPSRMPGFQYGLTSEEVDSIVAYLRTLK
ncbi:MAG: c-type cytochrome [Gammaproteobacteria bacterium]